MKNIRIFLFAALLLGFAGVIFAYRMYNKPHRDIASEKAGFRLTADELFDEYEADEEAADNKYLDQVIEVSGTVGEVTSNSDEIPVITLTAENALFGGVSATLSESGSGPLPGTGETVTLKCRCTGKLMDVVLVDCSITDPAS